MRRWMPLCLVAAALAHAVPVRVMAEEGTNPFARIDEERARQRDRQRRAGHAEPERPALPPMGGVGARPWRPDEPGGWQNPDRDRGEDAGAPSHGGTTAARPTGAPAIDREALPPLDERSRAVDRGEIAPAAAADGSGLPSGLWDGVAGDSVEKLVATLELPVRSPAMASLWRRVWTSRDSGSADGDAGRFEALAVEALVRAGMVREAVERTRDVGAGAAGVLPAMVARLRVATGDRERGCGDAQTILRRADLAKPVRAEMLLLTAWCAAADKNLDGAALVADLLKAEGTGSSYALTVLDAVIAGETRAPPLPKRVSLIDHRFVSLLPDASVKPLLERAEPALAAAVAADDRAPPEDRGAAAEAAARTNAIEADALGDAWRRTSPVVNEAGDRAGGTTDAQARRGALYHALVRERTPLRKVRLARQLLDDARRAGLAHPAAILVARATEDLLPVAEIGWFAETAIEANLVAGRYDLAHRWVEAAERERFDRGGDLAHWMVLIDLANTAWTGKRGEALAHAEQLSLRGRFSSELLHRLATVLDALDYQIPIPLWEAASRTPQPRTGHLPETGVLTRLQEASKRKEHARTVLLAVEALGPATADSANIIALGDVIRALRRAGLEADARRLALEAVLPAWPRQQGG